jgi:hypothetical protein
MSWLFFSNPEQKRVGDRSTRRPRLKRITTPGNEKWSSTNVVQFALLVIICEVCMELHLLFKYLSIIHYKYFIDKQCIQTNKLQGAESFLRS